MPLQIRDFTESALEKLLDTMVKEGREPDGWEAQSLLAAMGYVLALPGHSHALIAGAGIAPEPAPASWARWWNRRRQQTERVEGRPTGDPFR